MAACSSSSRVPLKSKLERRKPCRCACLVNVCTNALFERVRREINFANQASAILIVDQRRATPGGELDLRAGKPFIHDGGELGSRDRVSAVVVSEVSELRLECEANKLLSTIIFVDPCVACCGSEGQGNGFPDGRLRSEMFSPHHRAALAAVTEHDRRPGADDACSVTLDVATTHVFI